MCVLENKGNATVLLVFVETQKVLELCFCDKVTCIFSLTGQSAVDCCCGLQQFLIILHCTLKRAYPSQATSRCGSDSSALLLRTNSDCWFLGNTSFSLYNVTIKPGLSGVLFSNYETVTSSLLLFERQGYLLSSGRLLALPARGSSAASHVIPALHAAELSCCLSVHGHSHHHRFHGLKGSKSVPW